MRRKKRNSVLKLIKTAFSICFFYKKAKSHFSTSSKSCFILQLFFLSEALAFTPKKAIFLYFVLFVNLLYFSCPYGREALRKNPLPWRKKGGTTGNGI
jgi:hypothetical protein